MSITAHTIIKNEENFIWYAIKSVVDFVDKIIVFDTGSTDKTVAIIQGLVKEYPDKIIFEEKGECDKKRHTELRQEMVDRTTTNWFMILDGDEVWTKRGMDEVVKNINQSSCAECLVAPFYLCVGDIYHRYYKEGCFKILGRSGFFSPRVIKKVRGVHWLGDYNQDTLMYSDGKTFEQSERIFFLKNKYWHLTHLVRSSVDETDYSSGGSRLSKRRLTYFFIGKKIDDLLPEVFNEKKVVLQRMSLLKSFFNLISLCITNCITKIFN